MTPAIRCAYTELVEVAKLHPHPKNPNRHPAKQVRTLAKYIQHTGWRSPIVVSKRSGYIVAGHGRLQVAQFLKLEAVPVDYQEFASEADEVAHLVADNRLPELADMDMAALEELVKVDLIGAGIDIDMTGLDPADFASIEVAGHERKAKREPKAAPEICCPSCGHKWQLETK